MKLVQRTSPLQTCFRAIACAAIALSALATGHATAGLIGSSVTLTTVDASQIITNTSTVVDPGVEFSQAARSVDVMDSYFVVTDLNNLIFDNQTHTLTLAIDALLADSVIAVSLDPTSTAPFDSSRLSFSGHNIVLNYAGYFMVPAQFVRVNLTFEATSSVPEPGTMSLMGLALAVAAIARRRKT